MGSHEETGSKQITPSSTFATRMSVEQHPQESVSSRRISPIFPVRNGAMVPSVPLMTRNELKSGERSEKNPCFWRKVRIVFLSIGRLLGGRSAAQEGRAARSISARPSVRLSDLGPLPDEELDAPHEAEGERHARRDAREARDVHLPSRNLLEAGACRDGHEVAAEHHDRAHGHELLDLGLLLPHDRASKVGRSAAPRRRRE